MKVSVIIPAYNSEEFIAETLDSVLNQSLLDIEVIVINDGSSDRTIDIAREYETKYDNLTVIDKENGGVSAARNDGLDIAKGEFVYFVDADDTLALNALENMYNQAVSSKADLVIADYDIFDEYKNYEVFDLVDLLKKNEVEKYDEDIIWTFSLCNKLFKKEIIDKYNMRLEPLTYSEDGVFTMRFVYRSNKITTLDQVVFHYRRLHGSGNAATENISPKKIRDYIKAHGLIIESAKESILRDFPNYKTIEEAMEDNPKIKAYLNLIVRKELKILIHQFYSKFWLQDDEIVSQIVDEINYRISTLDAMTTGVIVDEAPEVTLFNLPKTKDEMLSASMITVLLYGTKENEEQFVECLKSLANQNMVRMKVIVNSDMKDVAEGNGITNKNILYVDASDKWSMYYDELSKCDTYYIIFADERFVYSTNACKLACRRFIKGGKDFTIEEVFHTNLSVPQPIYLNKIAKEAMTGNQYFAKEVWLDRIVANKAFKTKFLRGMNFDKTKPLDYYVDDFYKKGYYQFYGSGSVVFNDDEEKFRSLVDSPEVSEFIDEIFEEKEFDLNSNDIIINPQKSFIKLLDMYDDKNYRDEKWFTEQIEKCKNLPVKDQVLFFSIRKDKVLEGNAKALYPYINGKKKIIAKMLPHNKRQIKKMIKELATSKVIITDDYVKYLRYFPLKENQRFIQLWHACGAFKMFGKRGTNMAMKTDMATHAQYNLVCVSGKEVRPIYADAFDVRLRKVRDIGVPRTDDFFNDNLIEETKAKVYAKYPEFKNKKIVIYAPTFRDTRLGRDVFKPEIDFEKLSKNMPDDQMFVICPHPVMKNNIVEETFDNIKVVRDFSTNDMMLVSDMLVTDYSSVIFEYALLNKPIAFFCYDLDNYDRGFYLKYPDDLPGDVYQTQEELEKFLNDKSLQQISDKHKNFVESYMSGCDGKSAERIANLVNSYMEGK